MSALQVSWDARAADFKAAVETLSNVEEVEVTKDRWTDEAGYDFYRWTVRTDGRPGLFSKIRPMWLRPNHIGCRGRNSAHVKSSSEPKDLRIFLLWCVLIRHGVRKGLGLACPSLPFLSRPPPPASALPIAKDLS